MLPVVWYYGDTFVPCQDGMSARVQSAPAHFKIPRNCAATFRPLKEPSAANSASSNAICVLIIPDPDRDCFGSGSHNACGQKQYTSFHAP
jgi:hypothetical protein